jgi:CNT family concentrative nucleoside transporter
VAAANIFVGQTEAPFVARPYVPEMTRSELMAMMTSGFATIAGGVMAAYVGFGIDAGHLLAASVMSAPAALVCSKLMVPEIEESLTKGVLRIHPHKNGVNVIDAAAIGATEGLHLALNVLGMLIAFIAIVALLNGILTYTGSLVGLPQLTFEWLLGYAFAPVSFLMGVPWHECRQVGVLLGERLVLNEFVAYYHLKQQLTELSPRTVTICTYALCGFCNFGSVAIQLGGIGTLAPDRRGDLARLGIRALIAGTFACLMTACIAGILI